LPACPSNVIGFAWSISVAQVLLQYKETHSSSVVRGAAATDHAVMSRLPEPGLAACPRVEAFVGNRSAAPVCQFVRSAARVQVRLAGWGNVSGGYSIVNAYRSAR